MGLLLPIAVCGESGLWFMVSVFGRPHSSLGRRQSPEVHMWAMELDGGPPRAAAAGAEVALVTGRKKMTASPASPPPPPRCNTEVAAERPRTLHARAGPATSAGWTTRRHRHRHTRTRTHTHTQANTHLHLPSRPRSIHLARAHRLTRPHDHQYAHSSHTLPHAHTLMDVADGRTPRPPGERPGERPGPSGGGLRRKLPGLPVIVGDGAIPRRYM